MKRYHAYYIDRSNFEKMRKGNSSASIQHCPDVFVEPIQYYDAESFLALIGPAKSKEYHTRSGIIDYGYFKDYQAKKAGVFTFDGATFYKILDYIFTVDNRVEVNLLRIREIYGYRPNTGFMLMPFKDPSLKDFYEVHIKNFLKSEMKIEILRADDFCDNDVIIDTIYSQIENAEFVIAEISAPNKNVFYELGYADAKQKDIIAILRPGKTPDFFDRAHIRWIGYDIKDPQPFKERLAETIKTIRNKRGCIE
ncbi:MAG: hypothetical protein ACUZ77_04680 [Candidatus Brocadiales bacterium]